MLPGFIDMKMLKEKHKKIGGAVHGDIRTHQAGHHENVAGEKAKFIIFRSCFFTGEKIDINAGFHSGIETG
jgi:hypothetical protein